MVGIAVLSVHGCSGGTDPIDCGTGGCDGDGDVDGDGDSDGDGDGDGDLDADADQAPGDECTSAAECVLSLNFNVCCPCAMARALTYVNANDCIVPASEDAERPEGCGGTCYPELCSPCEGDPSEAICSNGRCVDVYPGECTPGETAGCDDGEICALVDGEAQCVDDPNECGSDADCTTDGYACRDWRSDGVLWCWHPDSTCYDDLMCRPHYFCEDTGGGVYGCVDGSPDCRPDYHGQDPECEEGEVCTDPDGDGHGSCS